jgi:hypothetical protein
MFWFKSALFFVMQGAGVVVRTRVLEDILSDERYQA